MRIEKYNGDNYPALAAAAKKVRVGSLLHRDFVDYYYLGQPWSELHLALDEDGACTAFIGYDRLRFENGGQELPIGFATNFFTLQPGTGGFLWLQWMKSCGAGIVFGGSEDTHHILKKQKFTYYPGVNVYTMNARYSIHSGDPAWRAVVKLALQPFHRKPLGAYETAAFRRKAGSITVEEISSSNARRIDSSCFAFRFAPTEEYMRWRYNSSLAFVRYRWFDIFAVGQRVGYCVLNDAPGQLIVAHSDGTDPAMLAYGILKAVFAAAGKRRNRSALLVSSHPAMQAIFTGNGFLFDTTRALAIGTLRSTLNLPDPDQWLLNFGIGDNDLRPSTFHTPVTVPMSQ